MNVPEHFSPEKVHGKSMQTFMQTVNGQECLGTFEPERSNALERIVDHRFTLIVSRTKELLYC
jgi:hypothetical protein